MNVTQLNSDLNAFVSKGDMISAITQFFADDSVTVDHTGVNLASKAEHLKKMEGFLGGIAKVNGITKHGEAAGDDISFSEYTFDFAMKDGSKILWHEVLLRNWKDGKVVKESYFLL
jgi:ketosteroid isomerase-like protein